MSATRSGRDARDPLWLAFYLIGLLLLLTPIFDLVSSAWPVQPGQLQWRYGFLGLLGNNLVLPLVGAGLMTLAAASLGHSLVLRVLSWTWLAAALLVLGASGLFVMDVLQLQGQVNVQATGAFRAGAAIAAGKYVLGLLALLALGIGGIATARASSAGPRGPREARPAARQSTEGSQSPRVVGG